MAMKPGLLVRIAAHLNEFSLFEGSIALLIILPRCIIFFKQGLELTNCLFLLPSCIRSIPPDPLDETELLPLLMLDV